MTDAVRRVRPVDGVVTVVLIVLAVLIGVVDATAEDAAAHLDSRSWSITPLFVLAALPVLWWRRGPVVATGTAATVMIVHDLLFGHIVRCGFGLPLAFALAFLAGLGTGVEGRGRAVAAWVLSVVLAGAVLVWDTAAGPGILPVVVLIQAVLGGIGTLTRHRAELVEQVRARNAELASLRERRAALEVADDRSAISRELETSIDARLRDLEAAADAAGCADDPAGTREALTALEEGGRRTLEDMRGVVGTLRGAGSPRGDDAVLAPTPTIAHLEELLDRRGAGALGLAGDPRVLPDAVELSAYRIVESLTEVLAGRPAVTLRFRPDALEIDIAGTVSRGADVRGALARVRERARLHAGSIEATVGRRRARVQAQLPVVAG